MYRVVQVNEGQLLDELGDFDSLQTAISEAITWTGEMPVEYVEAYTIQILDMQTGFPVWSMGPIP